MQTLVYLRQQAYRLGIKNSIKLKGFTISVGNLSVGGTGKSPLVQSIVDWSLAREQTPLVLTRGYGRKLSEAIFLGPGEYPKSVDEIGDEAAMLKGKFPTCALLVDANRARKALEHPDFSIVVMDDAFQHWQAYRDLDIVTWDVTENLEQSTLPWGRLREPVEALARTDLLVLTRVDEVSADELGSRIQTLQDRLRTFAKLPYQHWPWRMQRQENAWPPKIFLTRHKPTAMIHAQTQESKEVASIKGQKVLLICGIGRPSSFQKGVQKMGADILEVLEFPDHHVFTPSDIQKIRLRSQQLGKPMLLTTEKDFYRSSDALSAFPDLYFWQMALDFVHDGRQEFFGAIEGRMRWARS